MWHPRSRFLALGAMLGITVLVAACGGNGGGTPAKTIKIGLVTDTGGLNDRSFNHLAAVGLSEAASTGNICSKLTCKGQLGVVGDVVESHSDADYVPNLTNFATRGYDLVIGVGFLMGGAVGSVSGSFPHTHFAIIDAFGTDANGNDLHHSNVMSLHFKEQESGALVGVIAGILEKDHATAKKKNVIGAVGGVSIPPVDRYIAGYRWAAQMEDPGITILVGYSNDFTDASKCAGQAASEIDHGADVLFQVAGGCGDGVLTTAGQRGVYSIGVDADQGYVDHSVIASALKKVDVATYQAIKAVHDGSFKGGDVVFSLQNGATGYSVDNLSLPADVKTALADVEAKIKSGQLTPPDTKTW